MTKSLDRELVELNGELDRLGYKVVPHGDHLCVRLPLFASVRVHHVEGKFRFLPQFGPFGRTGGLFFTSGVAALALGGAAIAAGLSALTLVVGFLGVVALAHDACRFVITEGALTRLQQLATSSRLLSSGTPTR
jgi:hypothetical protein